MIDSLRAIGPVLVLDAGDFCGTESKSYGYDTDIMLDLMKLMKVDAVTLGDWDVGRGLAYLKAAETKGGFPIVAANVFLKGEGQARPFAPYIIKKVGRRKFGIIGVIGKDDPGGSRGVVFVDKGLLDREGLVLTDPLVALKEILPEVKKRSDVVVVIAHTGIARAREIATLMPEIDVVISGHGGDMLETPERPGAVLAKAGQRSDRVGILRIVTGPEGIVEFDGTPMSLSQDISPIDAAARKIVYDALNLDEKGERRREPPPGAAADSLSVKSKPPADSDEDTASRLNLHGEHFLGVSSCKDCHVSAWAQWSGTPHAKAYETLAKTDDWNNQECLPCHVTGYGLPGGHITTGLSPELWNVQCEECHDMGTRHAMKASEVVESACLKCHTKEMDADFDFARDIVKVIH